MGYENRNEVDELYGSLLIVVYLCSLDLDQLVADVLSNVEHDLILKHVLDHLVILSFEELQDIVS